MKPGRDLSQRLARAAGSERPDAWSLVAVSRDPLTPLALLRWALRDDAAGEAARAEVTARVSGLSATALAGLERAARSASTLAWLSMPADPASTGDVARLAPLGARSVATLGLCSCLRDGYVREAATRALIDGGEPAAMPFLMLRLDDVVPEVARRADDALCARWRGVAAPRRVRLLPLASALETRARASSARALGALRAGLDADEPSVVAAFESALRGDDPELRAEAAAWLADRGGASHDTMARVLDAQLDDPDARNRQRALRALAQRQRMPEPVLARVLPRLSRDRSPRTRARAATWWPRTRDPDAALKAMTLDPHAAVRLAARVALHGLGASVDVREMARATLVEAPSMGALLGALGALSDVGLADDAPYVARWAHDPRAKVRAAALLALASAAPTLYVDVACDALEGTGARVAAAAAELLRRAGESVDPARIAEALASGRVARGAQDVACEALSALDAAGVIRAVLPRIEGLAGATGRGASVLTRLGERVRREAAMGAPSSTAAREALRGFAVPPAFRGEVEALRRALGE